MIKDLRKGANERKLMKYFLIKTTTLVTILSMAFLPFSAFAKEPIVEVDNTTPITENEEYIDTDVSEKVYQVGTVKASNLNIRESKSLTSKILGKLPNGTSVIIESTDGDWHQITWGTIVGFIHKDYVINITKKTVEDMLESMSTPTAQAHDIISFAMAQLGKSYKRGSAGPNSFDCSGLVTYIFKNYGVSVPRSSKDYINFGTTIKKEDLLPGDILAFDCSGAINGQISHVGLYIGNGKMIHASTSKRGVIISDINDKYYKPRYIRGMRT